MRRAEGRRGKLLLRSSLSRRLWVATFDKLEMTSGPASGFRPLLFTHISPILKQVSPRILFPLVSTEGSVPPRQVFGRPPDTPARRAGPRDQQPPEGAAAFAPRPGLRLCARVPGPAGPYFSAPPTSSPSAK